MSSFTLAEIRHKVTQYQCNLQGGPGYSLSKEANEFLRETDDELLESFQVYSEYGYDSNRNIIQNPIVFFKKYVLIGEIRHYSHPGYTHVFSVKRHNCKLEHLKMMVDHICLKYKSITSFLGVLENLTNQLENQEQFKREQEQFRKEREQFRKEREELEKLREQTRREREELQREKQGFQERVEKFRGLTREEPKAIEDDAEDDFQCAEDN